jgi:hypothetical protein
MMDDPRCVELLAARNAAVDSAVSDIEWMLQITQYRDSFTSNEILDFCLDLRKKLKGV